MFAWIDMPTIVDPFLSRNTSRSVWACLVKSMYFSWTRMFLRSARRVELEVHCDGSAQASASSGGFVGWYFPDSPWSSPLRSSLLTVGSRLTVGSLPDSFAVPSAIGNLKRWFFEDKYLMHQAFPHLPGLLSKYLLSKNTQRPAHSPERFLVILSCQIDEFLHDLSVKLDDFQPLLKKYYWPFEWFSKPSYSRSSPFPGCRGHLADSK